MANAVARPAVGLFLRRNWLLLVGILALLAPTMALVARFSWSTEQGAHGPIVVATGLWLLLRQWHLTDGVREAGKPLVVFGALALLVPFYYFANVTQIVELQGYAMYGVLLVILYSFIGLAGMRKLWFPLVYLLFVFPPPDTLVALFTQPLKIWISKVAVNLLYFLGYPIAGAGVTIQVGQYQLLVAAACSGINSLISLSAISLFYVYMRHQMNWRYAALLMLAIMPVAIFANLIRVLILILLTYHFGDAVAQGFFHNFAGMTMFMTALLTIFGIDLLAEPVWRRLTKDKRVDG
jgi:exosortase